MKNFLSVLFCLFSLFPATGQEFWKELKVSNREQLRASPDEAGGLYTMDEQHRINYYSPITDSWTEIPSSGMPEKTFFVGLDKNLYSYGDGIAVLENGVWTTIFKKEGESVLSFSVSLSGQSRCWITTKGVYSQKLDSSEPKLLLEGVNTTAAVAFYTYGGEDALVLLSEKYKTEVFNPVTFEYLELTKTRSKTFKYMGASESFHNTTSGNYMSPRCSYENASITFSKNDRAMYIFTHWLDEPYQSDFWDTPFLVMIDFSYDEPVEVFINTKASRPHTCLINSRFNLYVRTEHSFVPNSSEFSWIRPGFYAAEHFSMLPDSWNILSDYHLGQFEVDPIAPNGRLVCDGADYLYTHKLRVDPASGEQSVFIVRSQVAAPTSATPPSLMSEPDAPLCSIEAGLLEVLDKTNLQCLSLYDISGRLLMKEGELGVLDISNMHRGAYLILVVRNGQGISQKVMIP